MTTAATRFGYASLAELLPLCPGGRDNFVTLADLWEESGLGWEPFRAALHQDRRAGRITLSSHEGLVGTLTPRMCSAVIEEAGSRLVYASLRK